MAVKPRADIEAACGANEELDEQQYLGRGELTNDEIKGRMRQRTLASEIVPVRFCVARSRTRAALPLVLDAVIDYLPAALIRWLRSRAFILDDERRSDRAPCR